MKPRINTILLKYIECKKCGFERSCPLPENEPGKKFKWTCPQCDKKWSGGFRKNGNLFVNADTKKSSNTNYILIEVNENLVPWILLVQNQTNGTGKNIKSEPSKSLILFSTAQDKINNPQAFPQYRAILHNNCTLEEKLN